jgi:hypothetical protein
METTIEELAPYMRGWHSYFGFCETPRVLVSLTGWVRRRLRAALWRQWPPGDSAVFCPYADQTVVNRLLQADVARVTPNLLRIVVVWLPGQGLVLECRYSIPPGIERFRLLIERKAIMRVVRLAL